MGLKSASSLSLALGFGSVWTAGTKGPDAGIHRFDPRTLQEIAKIPIPGLVGSIGDGAVWVLNDALYRVNRDTNQVTAKIDVGKDIAAMTAAEGSVWVLRDTGILSRIDPETNQSVAEIRIGQRRMGRLDTSYYSGLVATEGSVWITESISEGKLIRVDTKSNQVVAKIPVGNSPDDVVLGGGFIWVSIYFTNRSGHFVVKIDSRTNEILGKIFLRGTQPSLHASKDSLLAWGEDLKPGWRGRTYIWKIAY